MTGNNIDIDHSVAQTSKRESHMYVRVHAGTSQHAVRTLPNYFSHVSFVDCTAAHTYVLLFHAYVILC